MKKFTLLLSLVFAIVHLQAQDYKISFAGTVASTTVATVKVENLTKGTTLTLNGNDVLHLTTFPTGLLPLNQTKNSEVRFYPNPMKEFSQMKFDIPETGFTQIDLYDVSGRTIAFCENDLQKGCQSYQISGLRSGLYFVRIKSTGVILSGKLICNNSVTENPNIDLTQSIPLQENTAILKNATTEISMQYTKGDRLKITGTSGNFSTVVTDIPTQSKMITFIFIACTDADGNNYPIVQIGGQVWMAENLKTTKYRNGDQIPNVTVGSNWFSLTTDAYCWYNNDATLNKDTYGALYNGYATNDGRNIAPAGWRVPSDAEWKTLTTFLFFENFAGGCLKETGIAHWLSPNRDATNSSGFTALPGGYRSLGGAFSLLGSMGFWWTNVGLSKTYLNRNMYYQDGKVNSVHVDTRNGYSVRCMMELTPTISTTAASSITTTSAIIGGNIIYEGGAAVTSRGVCWNTTGNPTISNSNTTVGNETSNFSSNLTALSPNTTYYVRAYATNSLGTGYGSEISFKTYTAMVTDIDGNIYHAVTIGTQVWMVENLKTTKYNDGTSIPNVASNTSATFYCWYNNDASKKIFMVLYTIGML